MTPEVIVVGGGPAGLAAAIVLGRQGVPTCLVERREFPVDKPCGEGLLPNGVRAIERLGISRADLERLGHPITGVRYVAESGRTADAAFERDRGVGLRRVHLSALLASAARASRAIEIVTGSTAALSERPGGGFEVAVGDRRLTPRLVIVADGLGSHTARSLGIDSVVSAHRRWGVRQHFDGAAWTDRVEVYFADGWEAYVTPLDVGVNVALLWNATGASSTPGEPGMAEGLRRFPALERRLAGRTRLDRPSAAGPFHQHPRQRTRDGLLLFGDAGGYAHSLTGEGVGLAFLEAEILGEVLAGPLRATSGGGVVRQADLQAFVRAAHRASRPNHQLTLLLLEISRHPRLVERVIRLLDADAGLLGHCLKVNMGERSLWRMPLSSVARLPMALIRSGR